MIHEFAHKLDEENGGVDGNPVRRHAGFVEWAELFSRQYQTFLEEIEQEADDAIDDYGAHSPEEFFAVCSESFFEKPHRMQQDSPELYDQLSRFYAVAPASWQEQTR